MTKRIISLVLVFVMLFAVCVSAVSCAQLEEFIGEENLGEDYLNKYYPDRYPVGEGNTENPGNTENSGNTENPDDGNNGGSTEVVKGEHASYAESIKKDGYNLITFYWRNKVMSEADFETCDLWYWFGDESGAIMWEKCDYGGRVTLSVPENITEVGFIARKYCTQPGDGSSWGNAEKDTGADDLFATITGPDTFIYLKGGGDSKQYSSTDGGKTLTVIKKFDLAGMVDQNTIEYYLTPATKLSRLSQIKLYEGDREIPITKADRINLSSAAGKITVGEELDITKTYTLRIEGFGEKTVACSDIFDTTWFAENYHYSGDDLGATINGDGTTTFKVWAPTASKVVLNLYKDGQGGKDPVNSPEDKKYDMVRGDKGVWSYTAEAGHGTYYTYTVSTYNGDQEAVDPYAKSAGVNGNRGMVVDLSLTNPEGWEEHKNTFDTGIDSYNDAIIWEIHIRDFSNKIDFGSDEANEKYQGKYLAFTKEGLTCNGIPVGIDYLVELGVNFVHLLPSYDYATVDEDYLDEDCEEMFNWGYDPKNYNVPEGSYSSNPYDGAVRVKEYKEMVMALQNAGIGVIMDVVYNHTYDKNASLNMIVPNYYYRYKQNGANSSKSGCGNDTASERYMYGKFMVESVSYWQQEYNLDGFRFDLMGLHDMKTMQRIEAAVHTYDPKAILYGEGWDMMDNEYGTGVQSAYQPNIKNISATNNAIGTIAVFNDVIRKGLKGEDNDSSRGFMHGNTGAMDGTTTRTKVMFGVKGGTDLTGASWYVFNDMVVNYISAHDGTTLWDKLSITHDPTGTGSNLAQRLKMNRFGAAIIMTSRGIAFMQAGEEMLRSKPNEKDPNGYDRNSYRSDDEVNNIRWDLLTEDSDQYEMMQYYAGLIAIRKTYGVITNQNCVSYEVKEHDMGYKIIAKTSDGGCAVIFVNPKTYGTANYDLPSGDFYMLSDGKTASAQSIDGKTYNGTIAVSSQSVYIFVNSKLLNNPK